MANNGDGSNGKEKLAYCPNCNKPAIKRGLVIDCENCDASFRFTPEGPKVKQIGAIDDHESRLKLLEEKTGLSQPAQPQPAADDDQGGDDDQRDGEL